MAATASANSYVYWDGPPYYPMLGGGGESSTQKPLTFSHGRSLDGGTVCVDALYTNYQQVGSVWCSGDTVVKGNYGGGAKYAWGRATVGNHLYARLRAEW